MTILLKNVTLIFDLHLGKCSSPWCQRKSLTTRNTHVKYESSITCHSKFMANVYFFVDKETDKQTEKWTAKAKTIMIMPAIYLHL